MIVVRDVHKSYAGPAGAVLALALTSVEVAAGEVLCLTGDSGSGKSTLLGIMGLLRAPDEGSVMLDGRDCTAMSGAHRDRVRQDLVGLVPQNPRLFPELSALRNVALARRVSAPEACRDLLASVGLADRVLQPASTLSGGEQQRLSLARAVINRPRIVLADEPTSGLDDRNAEMVGSLLAGLAREGAAVVIATHDARAFTFATRMMTLSPRSAA